MAVVAGCQEVQGACLEGWKRLRSVWRVWEGGLPWERLAEGLEGLRFEGGKTAALNARKKQMAVVPGCQEVQRGLPAWRVALERLAEGLKGLRGLRAGKRQPWTPLKQMAVVFGCQEVQGACLEGCLGRLAERLEGLRGLRQHWTRVKTDGRRGVFGLEKPVQGGVDLKCCKRCKGPAWRVALERLAEGLEGLEGLRAGKRQPWTPVKTDGRGDWLPRGARGLLGGLPWKGLRSVCRVWEVLRQPWTPVKTDGRRVFGLKRAAQGGVALKCCKRCKGPAWRVALESKGLRRVWRVWRVWGVWGRANGSLERP